MALGWLCRRLPRGELFPNRSVPLFEGLKRWDKSGRIAERFQCPENGMAIPTGLPPFAVNESETYGGDFGGACPAQVCKTLPNFPFVLIGRILGVASKPLFPYVSRQSGRSAAW